MAALTRTDQTLFNDLKTQIASSNCVLFVGAGVSLAATNGKSVCSWRGLLKDGVRRCSEIAAGLPVGWAARVSSEIDSDDMDDLLSAAEKITRKLGTPDGPEFQRWLRDAFCDLKPSNDNVLKAIGSLNIPIVTTNYDGLLEAATKLAPVTWRQQAEVERVLRGEQKGIIHLHGYWEAAESVILGIRSYDQIVGDTHAKAVLQAIRTLRTIVYVGFGAGLKDPNFSAFTKWSEMAFSKSENRHFRLAIESEIAATQAEHSRESRIYAISFGKAYRDLGPFLKSLSRQRTAVLEDLVDGDSLNEKKQKQGFGIGIIGCGPWGRKVLNAFASLPNIEIAGICDLSNDLLQSVRLDFPCAKATTDHEAFLSNDDVQAVAIATPLSSHHELAKCCLKSGKHVLIEPPLAASSVECEELIKIAEKKRLVLIVGHTLLFSPAVRTIKNIVDCGDIGEIDHICSRRLSLGGFQQETNAAWDLGSHDLSIIRYLLEEDPISVNCQGHDGSYLPGIQTFTSMSLTFRRGKHAAIWNSWLAPRKVRQLTIVGTRRMIEFDDLESSRKVRIIDARVEVPAHHDVFRHVNYSYYNGDEYLPRLQLDEPLKNECKYFLECIGSEQKRLSDGAFGTSVVRILEAASASIRQHGNCIILNEHRQA